MIRLNKIREEEEYVERSLEEIERRKMILNLSTSMIGLHLGGGLIIWK